MTLFTVRIELHSASAADYEKLHLFMMQAGFLRTIVADADGIRYALPTGEYNFEGESTISEILARAQSAAQRTGKTSAILVTEGTRRIWVGLSLASPLLQ